jgi:hypothetical protein
MQKILFRVIRFAVPITVFLGAAQAFAFYSVTIKNATLQEIKVKIDLAVCSALNDSIPAGETKTIDTHGCCSKLVTVTGGLFSGTYTPPDTGFWMSCGNYSITVSMKKEMGNEPSSFNESSPSSFNESSLQGGFNASSLQGGFSASSLKGGFDTSSLSNGFVIQEGIH